MPIYAYKCSACGHAQDVLRKISDPVLTVCPECGQSTYAKQLTAAGFQLKGSGWYATDFRNNGAAPSAKPAASSDAAAAGGSSSSTSTSTGSTSSSGSAPPAGNTSS